MTWLSAIKTFSEWRLSWFLLFAFAVFFEFCALFFQHLMMLPPCVMCVYERVAMLGMGGAALIGMTNPSNKWIRWIGIATWGYSTFRGLLLAKEHVGYQFNPSPFATCDLFPNFPSWAPLNKWFPWMFEPTGDCSKIVWQFLDLSMPQWLVVIFAVSLVACIIVAVSQIAQSQKYYF
ncbi:MAG: disulfide bond formation protein DsbB [Vibrio sp.]